MSVNLSLKDTEMKNLPWNMLPLWTAICDLYCHVPRYFFQWSKTLKAIRFSLRPSDENKIGVSIETHLSASTFSNHAGRRSRRGRNQSLHQHDATQPQLASLWMCCKQHLKCNPLFSVFFWSFEKLGRANSCPSRHFRFFLTGKSYFAVAIYLSTYSCATETPFLSGLSRVILWNH